MITVTIMKKNLKNRVGIFKTWVGIFRGGGIHQGGV